MTNVWLFIRMSRPIFLLGVFLLYALGVGIAKYLGYSIDWSVYLLGQLWVTLLQLSTQYLNEYFNSPADLNNPNRTPLTGGSGVVGPGKLPQKVALYSALTCLAILSSFTILLLANVKLPNEAVMIMALSFLGSFFYSTPPIKLEATGYGELTASIIVASLVPAFAFNLQTGELHRFLAMSCFPLTILHLSMLIAFELPDFSTDLKFGKNTLLIRIGWQNSILLHNILILSAFLLLGVAALYGLPTFVLISAMIPLPIGLYQIWQMRRFATGDKPNWTSVTLIALVLFASTAYFITYAFWTH